MREHGFLKRVLLIYGDAVQRIESMASKAEIEKKMGLYDLAQFTPNV